MDGVFGTHIAGFGVLRAAEGGSRVGPLYASGDDIALTLMTALAARSPGQPISIDVPDINKPSTVLVEQLGLAPSFEAARMYTISSPDVEIPGIYGVTSLELG
jgi:hypothetical protein